MPEESFYSFESETIYEVERARAVRRASIVAEIKVVILGEVPADAIEDGEPSISGIKHSDSSRCFGKNRSACDVGESYHRV